MLSQITIYPIKSCAGIPLSTAEVKDRGFTMDRRWVLVDDDGLFISQRNTPRLGQVLVSQKDHGLQVSYPGHAYLKLELQPTSHIRQQARIWNDQVEGMWLGSECDEWFSKVLEKSVHLIHMSKDIKRPLLKERLPQDRPFEVSFADGYPYLLTSQSSLDDLNARLSHPVPMDRFRSNLVVSGFPAFGEDHWKRIRIGTIEFLVVKPCARCLVTTIDQKTGVASREPLQTLATFRRQNGHVMFGMNMVALNSGYVSLNDPVTIIE